MDNMFKISINLLTEKVRENLLKIQDNQIKIRNLLNQGGSVVQTEQLQKRYAVNQSLLSENLNLLHVQLNLANYRETSKENASPEDSQEAAPILKLINEYFELTLDGFLIYNSEQPNMDPKFYDRILGYSQLLESHEICFHPVK